MAVAKADTLLSADDLLAMGEIGPCELVRGRIVPMTPTGNPHGACEARFCAALQAWADAHGAGKVRVGEVGILTGRDPDTLRGADVVFISNERYARRTLTAGFLDVAPDLVVEVLSPWDRWAEVVQKLREYFAIGVRLVWLADPGARIVYVYRSFAEMRELGAGATLLGDEVLPAFAAPVATLFEE